uniref:DUF19 domain-containing protein n=1 Tax=Caenorhabditis tropicalis TaxID=1561998 RepID=A0A1I7U3Z4_9PELO
MNDLCADIKADLPKRRESYTLGRFCFFEVIKKECSAETVEILSSNFNYDNLINVLTTVPDGFADNCNRLHHSFNKLQCEALEEDIEEKEKEINWIDIQSNDTKLVEFLQLFDDAELFRRTLNVKVFGNTLSR